MPVRKKEVHGIVVFAIDGNLDFTESPKTKQFIDKNLLPSDRFVLLDLANCDRLDSVGMGVAISLHKRYRLSGGSFALVNVPSHIMRIFAVTNLDRVFTIYPTEADAVSAFGLTK